ncbi:MAG: hypothetical protein KIS66_09570 [Fimbriimonadaceae bacterium]|nr:hypothetical protein [Fimbriimonadaceae bacterium]
MVVPDSPIHAVLLYGPEGSGKTTLADLISQSWLCKTPSEGGACGACQACQAFSRARCADYQRIVPVGPSNWIKSSAIYPVPNDDDHRCVPVTQYFRTAPLGSRNKVVAFEDADRMNASAANALLKTLEEPPRYARLVLTTRHLGRILPTIQSRCLGVLCEMPSAEQIDRMLPDLSEAHRTFAHRSPAIASVMRANPEAFGPLLDFAALLPGRPRTHALTATEEFLTHAARVEKAMNAGARFANTKALEILGEALAVRTALGAARTQAVVEAHRRIVGNGNPSVVLDGLFSAILAESP